MAIVLLAIMGIAGLARGQSLDEEFRRDLSAICAPASRAMGTPGYERTVGYLKGEIAKLPNVELQVHEFPVMAPVTDSAVAELGGGASEKVYPFWPAQVRLNSTPAEGISGRAVYIGNCGFGEIRPKDLDGQIAVIEASAGQFWTHASYFGARAILVLGKKDTNHVDLRHHDINLPVNFPRFYVPPGTFADDLRAGRISGAITLKASVNWKRCIAKNLYALVAPATNPQKSGALMYSAPLEASGLVPDLANGAGQAVQTAAALALLRDASRRPVDRPVMVFFGGADSIQLLATREMFMALSDVPKMSRPGLEQLAEDRAPVERDLKRVVEVRDDPRNLDPAKDRWAIDRIVKIIETDAALDQDQLFRARMVRKEEQTPELAARLAELEKRQIELNHLRFMFQQKPAELDRELAVRYVDRTIERLNRLLSQYDDRKRQLERRIELYQWLAGRLGKDRDPGDRANNSRLIEMLVALDLSDRGVRAGPMFFGHFQRTTNISQIQDYRDWFSKVERSAKEGKPEAAWFNEIRGRIDFEPLNGARSPQSWLCAPMAIPTEMCMAWGVPGFTMMTLDDLRLRRDTPADTVDQIDPAAIVPQLDAVRELFRRAWSDPKFKGPVELKWQRGGYQGQVLSVAPGRPVPDLPREGFLATYYYTVAVKKIPPMRFIPWTLGVRRNEVRDCDAEGNYGFEGLPRLHLELQLLTSEVYRCEPNTGAITGSSDLGKQSEGMSPYADIRQEVTPIRSLVFNCSEISLLGLYDPRFLQDLGEVSLLDARRNAEPQRYNLLINRQFFSAFVEPDMSAYLVFRYGRVGNRLLLLDMKKPAEGEDRRAQGKKDVLDLAQGYPVAKVNAIGPLSLATAKDFHRVDDVRLAEYRAAGVSSSLLDTLHQQAGDQIQSSLIARDANDGREMTKHANGAWANEARVYQAAQDMANDVIYAAIFLLLLCVPFAFCMERLLISSPNIYKQITGTIVIFAVMTAALWSFHPAFKISSSPLIIILAFAIIFMSIVVISVVYGKFDTELKRIRSGRGTSVGASFASASVMMSAVLLGVANMRKRKFRTVLTSITVILITFAVLCFTSASRYLDTVTLPTGVESIHSGIMLRQRGFRPMPPVVSENLQSVLGGRPFVERWWNADAFDPKNQIHVIAGDDKQSKTFAATAVLGLSPGESKLSQVGTVIGEKKFARLENGETNIVYLCRTIAEQLGVKEANIVRIGGVALEVAGIFEAEEFDRRANMLSGDSVAPLKYSSGMLDAGGRGMADIAVESLDLDADSSASELSNTYEHLSSTQFVIVPAAISKILPSASLRIIEMRLKDEADVKAVSTELSKRFAIALFAGFNDGVKMVAASNLASVSGAGQVAIPLAIAGLIIFNTMMGSIAERRREIHVYTSLGLAPMHVGALFVAEALTYGLIGAVFGYVIGQGVGTLLLHLGWLGNVMLNYSGTSAMLTMSLILLIVLLSALVPARLASKIAAPSIERSWKVPLPKGDEIMAHLPFTINKTAADGALAYLAEYFDAHREGSIGKFSAGKVETFVFEDAAHHTSRGLKTVIWLTPFDLGVRQHLMLLIHPGEFPDIYEVQVVLQRLSGDDGSWYRMNRTFLTELRRQFLQWRSLSPQRMLSYIEESKQLFATKTTDVVTTATGEEVRLA